MSAITPVVSNANKQMHSLEGFNLLHSTTIPIRWGDMDAMGHVNNTVYFRYMEQARFEALSALGYTLGEDGTGPVIVNTHCTFLRPLKYPGSVKVTTYIGAIGRSSAETIYHMHLVEDSKVEPHSDASPNANTLYAEGAAKVVWIDLATEKSVPIPEHVRKQFSTP